MKNWFTRSLIILIIIFIALIIVAAFFFSENKLIVTAPIILLIAILVVLALSEVFDNFSIGNIISLKKENKKVGCDLEKSQQENRELRLQLTNIVANINTNHNTNIVAQLPDVLNRVYRVEKAPEDEVQRKKDEESAQNSDNIKPIDQQTRLSFGRIRRINSMIEQSIISKYCKIYKINISDIFREMRFSEGFIDYDPIMERNVIFDAYYKVSWQEEVFIEISNYNSQLLLDRFYYLLSKIYYYRSAKKMYAKLVLLVPLISDKKKKEISYNNTRGMTKERFCEFFAPAIKNNLLEIIEIPISDEEIDRMIYSLNI